MPQLELFESEDLGDLSGAETMLIEGVRMKKDWKRFAEHMRARRDEEERFLATQGSWQNQVRMNPMNPK